MVERIWLNVGEHDLHVVMCPLSWCGCVHVICVIVLTSVLGFVCLCTLFKLYNSLTCGVHTVSLTCTCVGICTLSVWPVSGFVGVHMLHPRLWFRGGFAVYINFVCLGFVVYRHILYSIKQEAHKREIKGRSRKRCKWNSTNIQLRCILEVKVPHLYQILMPA